MRLPTVKKNATFFFDKVYKNITLTNRIKMKGENLGEFEELVLLTCIILKENAYGINIVNEIKERMSRTVNLSSVHVTLYRLEEKGLVSSHMGGTTSSRGGRRKRIFEPTAKGKELLKELQHKKVAIWNAIPEFKLG